jgi:hypothetical protein
VLEEVGVSVAHFRKSQRLVNVIIHGHFYQPPRENPFNGKVPKEHGAEPFHDFNEKITAECYRPNIERGNFQHISYNFGGTLLAWLEEHAPQTYARLLEEEKSVFDYYGVSNAMAQVYNHVIMPLAQAQDIRTQVAWGVRDYTARFGHKPEGMWLSETAVNYQTLEALADNGIKFTILAPWQADHNSVETIDLEERALMQQKLRAYVLRDLAPSFEGDPKMNWAAVQALKRAVVPERFDPTEPYIVELRGGKSIVVFFYNAPLSGGVSFDHHATSDADNFTQDWLLPQVNTDKLGNNETQVVLVATDGELYGHHKSFRDQFLHRLTTHSLLEEGIGVTFPALYLKNNPPKRRIRLLEYTSWSCHHGIRRWYEGCDCTPGDNDWKLHLRHAFNLVAEEVNRVFAEEADHIFSDSRKAVYDFILVWNGKEAMPDFAARHFKPQWLAMASQPNHHIYRLAERLLKMQIYKHQMYTSCAWFFEDIDRIEPKNALAGAAICWRLLGRLAKPQSKAAFETELEQAVSNRSQHFTGLQLYRRLSRMTSNK